MNACFQVKSYLSLKAIGQVFGFRREMIAKGASISRFQVAHRLLNVSGGKFALRIIMIRFCPVESYGWPDPLLVLLPNERADGLLLVFFLNPA